MKKISREYFSELIKQSGIRPRLLRNLRFIPEEISDWEDRELLAVADRNNVQGVIIIELEKLYILPFQLLTRVTDKNTGRSKPITCDFCYTWQRSGNARSISFMDVGNPEHTFSFLCCADLECSLNVRDMTSAAILSRSQLHEDLTVHQRITRLQTKLHKFINIVGVCPTLTINE